MVVGVDANEAAIQLANTNQQQSSSDISNSATFLVGDVTTFRFKNQLNEDCGNLFDVCILQLLLSIVGGPEQRRQTLTTAFESLVPGGYLYASCSGVSDSINAKYAQLYQQDQATTGEPYTYCSRDDRTGETLYHTHHFTVQELEGLLLDAGFQEVAVTQLQEASSRRPNEAAYFLYVTARRPP